MWLLGYVAFNSLFELNWVLDMFWISWMMFMDTLQLCIFLCWMCFHSSVSSLFVLCLFLSLLLCLWCPCFALLFNFAQECKRVSVVDFDESLFSSIPLAFVYPFDSCSVLNCLSLVYFHLLGFIGLLFQIWVNFT